MGDQKIEEQREFVGWWGEHVARPGGDRQSKEHSPGPALMLAQAEQLTGITHQQVSKWAKAVKDERSAPSVCVNWLIWPVDST
jgi:hypothetical protein